MIKFRWGTKAFLTEVCDICIQVFFRVTLRQQRDTNHTWRRGPHLLCNYAFVPTWKDWKGSCLCYQGEPCRNKVVGRRKDIRKRWSVQFPVRVPKTISTISFGKISVIFKSYEFSLLHIPHDLCIDSVLFGTKFWLFLFINFKLSQPNFLKVV